MIVQEAGMAVGWPLGLGHDTTGWPLGLRLRLTQEDLQWPREPPLDDDSPGYSTTSSSLDTQSTRSFFQDKSISLGALIGLPISPTGSGKDLRRNRRNTTVLPVFPASSSSGSKCGSEHRHHHRHRHRRSDSSSNSRSRSSSGHSSHGSNRSPYKSTSFAGWALLSLFSCARVDEEKNRWSKSSSSSSSSSSSKSASRRGSEFSTSNPPEIQKLSSSSAQVSIPFIGRSPAPASKLYDNIMFEEEEEQEQGTASRELEPQHAPLECNPLFACSSLADDDELEEDPVAMTEMLEHIRASLMRSHSSYSDSSQVSVQSSVSESLDKGESFSSASQRDLFRKYSAIHMLLSRMVCCRYPPTIDR